MRERESERERVGERDRERENCPVKYLLTGIIMFRNDPVTFVQVGDHQSQNEETSLLSKHVVRTGYGVQNTDLQVAVRRD